MTVDHTFDHILGATSMDRVISLWDADSGNVRLLIFFVLDYAFQTSQLHHTQVLRVYRGHEDEIRAMAHMPERALYASSAWDGTIRFWMAFEPPSDEEPSTMFMAEPRGAVAAAAAAVDTSGENDGAGAPGEPSSLLLHHRRVLADDLRAAAAIVESSAELLAELEKRQVKQVKKPPFESGFKGPEFDQLYNSLVDEVRQ